MSAAIEARFDAQLGHFELHADLVMPGVGIIGLFGPSGCGKTSLLRCIAGLQRGARGRLVVNGECWQDDAIGRFLPTHRRSLGYVFQDTVLFPHMTVRGNLEYGTKRIPVTERRVGWEGAVSLLGIGHLLDRAPDRLSGGERQRVGIARALLASPRLLLLDEPLAALDVARKQEILPYLESLHDELSIPAIYVSHAPDEIARLADHIVVMEQGRITASGPLAETLARVDSPIELGEEAGVVLEGTAAERDGRWHLLRIDVSAGGLWVRDTGIPTGRGVRVRILASDVSLALDRHDSTITNILPGVVDDIGENDHPAVALVRVRMGDDAVVARLTRRSIDRLGLVPGRAVWVQIKAVALL